MFCLAVYFVFRWEKHIFISSLQGIGTAERVVISKEEDKATKVEKFQLLVEGLVHHLYYILFLTVAYVSFNPCFDAYSIVFLDRGNNVDLEYCFFTVSV